jgi:hypothetical protein
MVCGSCLVRSQQVRALQVGVCQLGRFLLSLRSRFAVRVAFCAQENKESHLLLLTVAQVQK